MRLVLQTLTAMARAGLQRLPLAGEIIACDPNKADTAVFCTHSAYAAEDSAYNTLLLHQVGRIRL